MPRILHLAAIQTNACHSPAENVERARAAVEQAARNGAQWVVLPEMFPKYGDLAEAVQTAEPIFPDEPSRCGPLVRELSTWARNLEIVLVAGSICEQSPLNAAATGAAIHNTQLVFDRTGKIVARYRKLHLFDVNVPGKVVSRESDHIAAGNQVVVETIDGVRCGLAICYDLRFPELFRAMRAAGTELILLPSAFTQVTGEAHWTALVRARAIENQCFFVAANQCGVHTPKSASHGHSLIVDPWGRVVSSAGATPTTLYATLDLASVAQVRERLPAWDHRRLPVDTSSPS